MRVHIKEILVGLTIPESTQALCCFRWLSYSQKALSVQQLQELTAIRHAPPWGIDMDARFIEPHTIRGIGPPFIAVSKDVPERAEYAETPFEKYLPSEQILDGPAEGFWTYDSSSHKTIVQTCISYLLHFKEFPISKEEEKCPNTPCSNIQQSIGDYKQDYLTVIRTI